MAKLPLQAVSLKGKRVLCRVDFNVPLRGTEIEDDTRIRETLPTVRRILEQGGKAILVSHLGRPKGKEPELSLAPVAGRLESLLQRPVRFLEDCIGTRVRDAVGQMRRGDVILLENLRFHPGEQKNDRTFAKELATLGDVYVNDAFAASHRNHASVSAVPRLFKIACAGLLLQKEIEILGRLRDSPEPPMVLILGGAKVSDKIPIIENLLPKTTKLLIGGALAYTFIKSAGISVGASLVEPEYVETASRIRRKARQMGVEIRLPRDHRVVRSLMESMDARVLEGPIGEGWMGVDIGPITIQDFRSALSEAKTVFWNGPLGAFEIEAFGRGTRALAETLAETDAMTVIGGGDTISAIEKAGVRNRLSHVSTGGGASMEFLSGRSLPGIESLADGSPGEAA